VRDLLRAGWDVFVRSLKICDTHHVLILRLALVLLLVLSGGSGGRGGSGSASSGGSSGRGSGGTTRASTKDEVVNVDLGEHAGIEARQVGLNANVGSLQDGGDLVTLLSAKAQVAEKRSERVRDGSGARRREEGAQSREGGQKQKRQEVATTQANERTNEQRDMHRADTRGRPGGRDGEREREREAAEQSSAMRCAGMGA